MGTSDGIIMLGGASRTVVSRGMSSLGENLYMIAEIANNAFFTASDSPLICSYGNTKLKFTKRQPGKMTVP